MARSGEIVLYGDIGFEITAASVAADMRRLGAVDELHVRINSFGGDAFDGVAIHQRLAEHKARVIVHIDGIAASAASVIAMAGDEIAIARAGFVMIHDAWVGAVGNAAELRAVAERAEALSAQMAGIYQRRSGQGIEQIRAWMAEERTFSSEEAIDAGLATRIVEAERMAARFDPSRHHFRREPPAELLAQPKIAAAMAAVTQMRMHLVSRGHRRA